ncbi:MAG: hypothetical protein JWN17_2163, partial [Frankiales bacterium]|nr:hypothetical protein [Frankiales bacterium]
TAASTAPSTTRTTSTAGTAASAPAAAPTRPRTISAASLLAARQAGRLPGTTEPGRSTGTRPGAPAARTDPSTPRRVAAGVPGLGYASFGGPPDRLDPVGDVDRNGSQDVLELRYRHDASGDTTSLQLVVRGGTTGRAAWSRDVRVGGGHSVSAFAARVGRAAAPGVVVLDQGFPDEGRLSMRLTALEGRTGRVLWSYLDDQGTQDARSDTLPLVFDDLDGALVVGRWRHVQGASDAEPVSGALRPLRLDLADGRVRDLGPLAASSLGVPTVASVPDVSGDGHRDLAVLTPGRHGDLQLRSGTDGSALWTTPSLDLAPDAEVLPAGAVSGTTVGGSVVDDVALATGHPVTADGSRVRGARGEVLLLAGHDGAPLLRRAGDQPVPLLRAGRPTVPALGVASVEEASAPDGSATATRTVTTYRADGTQVSSASAAFRAAGSGEPADPDDGPVAYQGTYPVGDLDRDGALDLYSVVDVFGTDDDVARVQWLDGATGRVLPVGPRAEPLLGHLSSHGDDLVELTPGDGVVVAGVSGRTGRAAFRRVLGHGTRFAQADARALPVSGSPCDDVGVTGNGVGALAAVLRSDGSVRWSLQEPAGGSGPRTVRPGPPASPRCG